MDLLSQRRVLNFFFFLLVLILIGIYLFIFYFPIPQNILHLIIIGSLSVVIVGAGYFNHCLNKNKKCDEALVQMEGNKNEFISMVTHELRTPVTSIQGSVNLLKCLYTKDEDQQQLVEILENNCERLNLLINDILDLDKITANKMKFDFKQHELFYLVSKAIALNEGYAEKFNITLVKNQLLPGIFVTVDENRLIQVFTNLLSNAIKFADNNSKVIVAMEYHEANNQTSVSFTNVGKGISKEFAENIFTRFSQQDSASAKLVKGTGLGLAISKSIIEKLNGMIHFTSIENKETTFYVTLPVSSVNPSH